jgi:hypothetical protein
VIPQPSLGTLSLSNRRSTAHRFFGFRHPPIRHQNPHTLDLAYKKFKNLTLSILCYLPLPVAEDTAKLYLYGKAFVTILWAPTSPSFFSVLNVAAPPLNAIGSCDVYFRRYLDCLALPDIRLGYSHCRRTRLRSGLSQT